MSHALDLRNDLLALFGEGYGRTLTITRTVPGAYDPATGSTAAASTVTITGIGRVGDYSDMIKSGALIKENDRRATFLPDDNSAHIEDADTLNDGGNLYSVITVKKRELGASICFTLQLRQ